MEEKGIYEIGKQPCSKFKHQRVRQTGVEVTDVCVVCGKKRAMCMNCGSWHHSGGWTDECTPELKGKLEIRKDETPSVISKKRRFIM